MNNARPGGFVHAACVLVVALLAWPGLAAAQSSDEADSRPAFSLSTSEVFTTRDAPHFYLSFRRIPSLDVRVYKVKDPFAFFAGLRDPHQLGSYNEVFVPQERSALERFGDWKRRQRSFLRDFLRGQASYQYRAARTRASDRSQTALRVQLNVSTFAQVPLLNPNQLVTSWREILPNHRDTESRRVPLEVKAPGVYVVEAVNDRLRAYTVVIVSDVGVVTKTSPGQVLMFAAHRFSGEPVADCQVRLLPGGAPAIEGRTSADGVFEATLPDQRVERLLGIAQCGDQIAATDPGAYSLQRPAREMVGYIYTDKPIYRPGQEVHVKAVLRWRERDALTLFDRPQVELVAKDVNDKAVFRRQLTVDAYGAVHATFSVPATAALGTYALSIQSQDLQTTSAFEVQEYRKPEFEVIVTPAARFVIQGREALVTVQAKYYFGQPVANGQLRWTVNQQPYTSPLRWDEGFEGGESTYFYGDQQTQQGTLRLDADGRAQIRVPLAPDENGRDYSARIEAQVTDASSRQVSGATIVHATWGAFMVSARIGEAVLRAGSRVEVAINAIDYLGVAQGTLPVSVDLDRLEYSSGYYAPPTTTRIMSAQATTDAAGRASATVTLPAGLSGSFKVTVTARSEGRAVTGEAWVWVPGQQEAVESGDRYLELIADRRSYQPGDTARLVVRGEPAVGPIFVTKEGQHVSWYRVLRPSASDAIEVPVEAGDAGDVYVSVAYLRDGRLYRAERRLSVPATEHTLQVTVTADQPVARPRDPGTFTVRVVNQQGDPVRAQVTLAVIDEAVYGVKADETPDPVRFFYRREYTRVSTTFSREYYFTGFSGAERLQLAGRRRRPFTLADFKGDKPAQPEVRKDFPDAIYWLADLVTDANGQGRVSVKYPDALTTWRLTARAVTTDTRAGVAVARTTTTKDLIVRLVTPRFLTEGDEVVLPTIVHNYQQETRTAAVDVKASGLEATGRTGDIASAGGSIGAGGERRDDWRYTASSVGTARVVASARTETDTDAVELPIPVVPYGLRREVGSTGSIVGAGEATATVTVPSASNPAARSIRVSLAPSLSGSLLGALDFLTSYPYGCTEQTLSSFLPNLLVTRALTQLQLAPTERLSALDRMVSAGLQRLLDMQHDDGGWGWWKSDANHPYMTAYALWGLEEARRAGVKVDQYRILNGARALARMYQEYPRAIPDLKAYMAYALQRAAPGRPQIEWFGEGGQRGQFAHATARDELWAARDRMSAYGRALLLLLLDETKDPRGGELATALEAEAVTTGELSSWKSDQDPLLFESIDTSVEATALAVQALAARNPKSPLVERAVRFLLLNRTGGYWGTTKQTATAIYGLLVFMQARGERAQPFAVDVFVNGALTGRQTFSAASMTAPDPLVVMVPAKAGPNEVRLVKRDDGGTVYWSASAIYFDTTGAAARTGSRQLAVARRYALLTPVTVQDKIVYRETAFAGTAKPGDVLTVRLTIAGATDWRYLVLEDPLPAGVEAVQDTTAYPLERDTRTSWWWGSRVEYRDQRTVFFQEGFERGRYEYVYLVKVTSAGTFRAVPAQIAPMYVPGVFASSEPQTMTVAAPVGGAR